MPDEPPNEQDANVIKQGSIAQFMRKRTQLVGFDTGHFKHVQYVVEFLDNALDAIETFHWKTQETEIGYRLEAEDYQDWINVEDELMEATTREVQGLPTDLSNVFASMGEGEGENGDAAATHGTAQAQDAGVEQATVSEKLDKDVVKPRLMQKTDTDTRMHSIIEAMESLINENLDLVQTEPVIIMRLTEVEDESLAFLDESKNMKLYCFEIFDSGTGIGPSDLERFGTYLASSKSEKLKQTRGSQGFGSPSAFSDAQNTTGKPIQLISKHYKHDSGYVSEFFTTGENKKSYTIEQTAVDTDFMHGTYIRLFYTNIRYIRGYVDTYVKQTALMNSHVNIIYYDPYSQKHDIKRLVSEFPEEPKYAKPHPSSINIGEFQDMLRTTSETYVRQFFVGSFVRISDKIAQGIIADAEEELQDRIQFLRLTESDYITVSDKKNDYVYTYRKLKRITGKAKTAKPTWVVSLLNVGKQDAVDAYKNVLANYKGTLDKIIKLDNKIKKLESERDAAAKKKDKSEIQKNIKNLEKDKKDEEKNKTNVKKAFMDFLEKSEAAFEDITDEKVQKVVEEKYYTITIGSMPPRELQELQVNILYKYFTLEKYLSPPTDTAIPVSSDVLESVLIQEFGLKISKFDQYFTEMDADAAFENDMVALPEIYKDFKENRIDEFDESSKIFKLIQLGEAEFVAKMTAIPLVKLLDSVTEIKKDRFNELVQHDIGSFNETELYSEEIMEEDLDFVSAVTRPPTSGKGLAFVVEAAIAYGTNVKTPAKAADVVYRFVNRTPKLRDNADCAIWKAVALVNWKNYMLDTFDNGIPKAPIRVFVNVSGPFVHLMFKSQSKQALAEDDNLSKEIKLALEQVGRRLRAYVSKKQRHAESKKRALKFLQFAPHVARSIYNILLKDSTIRDKLAKPEAIEERIVEASGKKPPSTAAVADTSTKAPSIPTPRPASQETSHPWQNL